MSLERYREYLDRVETSPAYWHEGAVIEFTEGLCRLMEEKKVSRAELARRMGTSRAYITKLLGGDANFTLMTMVKLSMAVGGRLHVHIADRQASTHGQDALPHQDEPEAALKRRAIRR